MDTIFSAPLTFLAVLQILYALLLMGPKAVALPVAQLGRSLQRSTAANSVIITLAVALGGLFFSSIVELLRNHDRALKADVREVVHTIDYLRAQVSCVLCALNLLLLFLSRALGEAICTVDHSGKNLDAMKRQVKGLQTEYERVTSTPKPAAGPAAAGGGSAGSGAASTAAGAGAGGETEALKRQVDKLIKEKQELQAAAEASEKAKQSAEASVAAMKSQVKGFDKELDRLLEENNHLKRRLAGAGDAKMQAEVLQAQGSRRKDD